ASLQMTSISLFLCLLCIVFSYGAPVDENALGDFVKGDLTSELFSLMEGFEKFTPADLNYLKNILKDRETFASEHEILDKMRREKPELYEKFIKFLKPFYAKMKKLNLEAQQFFLQISEELSPSLSDNQEPSMESLMTIGFKVSSRYSALSDAAKESIKAEFPLIAKGFAFVADLEKSMAKMLEM
ncbi:hypothetical protein PENTCL1PPCAC_8913, partial [Pristionchus entomophagus]